MIPKLMVPLQSNLSLLLARSPSKMARLTLRWKSLDVVNVTVFFVGIVVFRSLA